MNTFRVTDERMYLKEKVERPTNMKRELACIPLLLTDTYRTSEQHDIAFFQPIFIHIRPMFSSFSFNV